MKENSCSQGTSGRLFLSLHSFVIRLKPREDYKRENEDFERNGRPEVVDGEWADGDWKKNMKKQESPIAHHPPRLKPSHHQRLLD